MLKVIKDKNKSLKNKIIYSKKNYQTNSTSINKNMDLNINKKDNFSNKLLARILSWILYYRKIEKNKYKNKRRLII